MSTPNAVITSPEALADLLDEFGWFEDGQCLSLAPRPGEAAPPDQVELILRDFGTGSLEAGDTRTYHALRLTAPEPDEWSFDGDDFIHFPEHVVEGAEPVEGVSGFGIKLDVPTTVRLVARSFKVERLPEVTEEVRPWTSDRELHIRAPGANVPRSRDWVQAIARERVDAVWRVYGDLAAPSNRVPETDYVGWFLDRPSRLRDRNGGVFFRWVAEANDGSATLALERWEADDELWVAACRAAARIFPEGEFATGNCRFSSSEWLEHLAAAHY